MFELKFIVPADDVDSAEDFDTLAEALSELAGSAYAEGLRFDVSAMDADGACGNFYRNGLDESYVGYWSVLSADA
ncbi:hypothetical protein J4T94_gp054 [Mycobacterium phage Krypton555]|uniref:Uncharacterized protein n=2 Tax=Lumosvirus TaxID=2948808 RepID=A0A222ZS77_9CAUD|nr:hypothetical protein N852_gp051 [Mycobacterium phage Whirlwind]YP_010012713.1 hypothetical protein J4T94_gp054 [Mycobacterium phage Krypton555]AGT12734.1 hypothetical protein PBI_WHIRLWIND_138 [Mycobacterium phage Whirlwind]ASR87162.1 hypothetical protein KRYPTON555_138 [Mycobacterium phage Krypton555]